MAKIIGWFKSVKLSEVIVGFFLGIVTFLTGLLAISEKRRQSAEKQGAQLELENIELKVKDEINSQPITDVISEHQAEIDSWKRPRQH